MTYKEDASRPSSAKPTMLWDGKCDFCAHWIERWAKATGGKVVYRPYQEALADFPQVDEEKCIKAVQLVLPDGQVFSAAHAVLKSLAISGRATRLFSWYEHSRLFRCLADSAYRFVAANRSWLPRF